MKKNWFEERLLANSATFANLQKSGDPARPIGVSIAVTGRCNSRCLHCRIWELSRDDRGMKAKEMTREEILSYLRDPYLSNLVELDITGGEPFLREDLVDIVRSVVDLKHTDLKNLKTIIIPSNGFLVEKVIRQTEIILALLKNSGVDFVSVISLDGLGRTHDMVRGIDGAYEKTSRTIAGLLGLKARHGGFWPGIKTTVTRYNVIQLETIRRFAVNRDMFYIISPVITAANRFRNREYQDQFRLSREDCDKLASFYKNRKEDLDFYYEKALAFLKTGERQSTCTALFNYLFIDHDRMVYPCPIHDVCVGDLSKSTIEKIITSTRAASIRKSIGSYPICKRCTEPGALRYSGVMEGTDLLRFVKGQGRGNFDKAIIEKGLDKLL